MNLLFNLTYPAQQNTTVTIVAATLRLYKLAQVLLLTLMLNTMEQSPSWKAHISSASQEFPPHNVQPEVSLQLSQQPAICPHPEPDKAVQDLPTDLNIILPSTLNTCPFIMYDLSHRYRQ